ncbi:MAG: hypothetical protein V8R91_13180 [Butyricimonas faecihominis]
MDSITPGQSAVLYEGTDVVVISIPQIRRCYLLLPLFFCEY